VDEFLSKFWVESETEQIAQIQRRSKIPMIKISLLFFKSPLIPIASYSIIILHLSAKKANRISTKANSNLRGAGCCLQLHYNMQIPLIKVGNFVQFGMTVPPKTIGVTLEFYVA
jgi:hypothetical protein